MDFLDPDVSADTKYIEHLIERLETNAVAGHVINCSEVRQILAKIHYYVKSLETKFNPQVRITLTKERREY